MLEATLVMDSLEPDLRRPDGGRPPELCTAHDPGFIFDGDLLTLPMGANRPKFGWHVKYLEDFFRLQRYKFGGVVHMSYKELVKETY